MKHTEIISYKTGINGVMIESSLYEGSVNIRVDVNEINLQMSDYSTDENYIISAILERMENRCEVIKELLRKEQYKL